jgi:hypothetical protein
VFFENNIRVNKLARRIKWEEKSGRYGVERRA